MAPDGDLNKPRQAYSARTSHVITTTCAGREHTKVNTSMQTDANLSLLSLGDTIPVNDAHE